MASKFIVFTTTKTATTTALSSSSSSCLYVKENKKLSQSATAEIARDADDADFKH